MKMNTISLSTCSFELTLALQRGVLGLGLVLVATAPACSASIAPEEHEVPEGEAGERVVHETAQEGTRTQVDSTDESAWVYLDLDTGAQLDEGESGWELAFQRYHIKLNGGVSGDEGVEAVILVGEAFASVDAAPEEGWQTDAADGDDDDDLPDFYLDDWYAYDSDTHVLTPLDEVYVVRSTDGYAYKIRIDDYYNEAGTSGHFTFTWDRL